MGIYNYYTTVTDLRRVLEDLESCQQSPPALGLECVSVVISRVFSFPGFGHGFRD